MGYRMNPEELIGRVFGRLTVLNYDGFYDLTGSGRKKHWYECVCSCGNKYLARRDHLLENRIKSCGRCQKIEKEGEACRYITSKGEVFLFDQEDLGLAMSYSWCISNPSGGNKRYVVARNENGRNILFSRTAMSAGDNELVDHINGDPLDNRRSNMRIVSIAENSQNTALRSDNSSGYKGVGYVPLSGKYRAYIGVNNKFISLGHYLSPEEAARAYDKAARFYFGEYACLNFPMEGEQGCHRNQTQ